MPVFDVWFFVVFIVLLIVSFLLAWRSMKDLSIPQEVKEIIKAEKQIKGTIIFLKDKIINYSSSSS